MKHIAIEDIKIPKPNFAVSKESKGQLISSWLINLIKHLLECGIADVGDFLPSKDEFAKFLDVSPATMQISIRQVKNLGYLNSKQSIGTYIADFYSNDIQQDDCLCHSSVAVCKIKKIILDEKIRLNFPILSISELSKKTNISQNTIRFALEDLAQKGFLQKKHMRGNKYSWIYKKEFVLTKDEITHGVNDEDCTLTHQLVEKIKKYIERTYKVGEKILPNKALSNMFDVSVKTINDAMKVLNARKVILSRRGRYGTIYLGGEKTDKMSFVSSEKRKMNLPQNYNYSWQKALHNLKKYIIENYEVGDKIPPIRELALILNVSPNTIRRALQSLVEGGFLVSQRGKLGGIFITDMPQGDEEAYRWLALNPDAISFNQN